MKPLAMWEQWQTRVKLALPNFCESPIYVSQDVSMDAYERVARYIVDHCSISVWGKTLGEEYGATVVDVPNFGRVTRMWMDSMVEVNFIAKHLNLLSLDVLDIGAGYGRLAAAMSDLVNTFTCTDAVPISRFICEFFILKHAPLATVRLPENLLTGEAYNLALNVHSWSECSMESIDEWLFILRQKGTPYLFTVPHDDFYYAYGGGSFRSLIEKEFELMEEAKLGLHNNPHALWKRR